MGEKFPPRVWLSDFEVPSYSDQNGEIEFLPLAEHEYLIEEKELDYQALSRMHAALAAENARLREALEKIAATPNRNFVEDDVDDKIEMRHIARAALTQLPPSTDNEAEDMYSGVGEEEHDAIMEEITKGGLET